MKNFSTSADKESENASTYLKGELPVKDVFPDKQILSLNNLSLKIPPSEKFTKIDNEKNQKTSFKRYSVQKKYRISSSSSVCLNDPCGEGVACFPKGDSFACVCSDGTELAAGQYCPNIKPVNLTPPAISMSQANEASFTRSSQNFLIGIVISFGVFVLISMALIYWRRKYLKRLIIKQNEFKLTNIENGFDVRKTNALPTHNITTNPQYFIDQKSHLAFEALSASLSVEILSKTQIEFLGEIGEGCFGKVYRGLLLPIKNEERKEHASINGKGDLTVNENTSKTDKSIDKISKSIAIKILKDSSGSESEQDFLREVELMSSFQHPNILSLMGIVNPDNSGLPWMIFEYMPYGDLAEFLRSSSMFSGDNSSMLSLSKKNLLNIAIQVAEGMGYLSQQHFVHRDLACRNCLVGDNLTVKISDFGMSRDVYTCDYYKVGGSRLLPIRWMAPESILYGKFTLESDVWSFGIVLWEIYSLGKQPYFGNSNEEVVKLILDGVLLKPPEACPHSIQDIMSLSWKPKPSDRLAFTDILQRLNKSEDDMFEGHYIDTSIKKKFNTPSVNQSFISPDLPKKSILSTKTPLDSDEYLVPMLKDEVDEYLTILPNPSEFKAIYQNILS